ncbi:NSFL1 cofactor p47 [Strongylocentrotus purpuratus]|uniref:Uncharacterized protein n=1 Tax=Strongylocentrotus purpuratus TaxID=7668 RepID=A0A7M7T2F8_STRPU|nr:NSFL1 cofactor p47 [Strongylocentrotus purpuratus]
MAATSAELEKDGLLTQFIGVTGAERERASFFLESSGWKLEVALESFYDNSDDMVTDPPSRDPPSERQPEPPRVEPPPAAQPQGGGKAKGSAPKGRGGSSSRIATLGDYSSKKANDDSDEEGQAFYAGGPEHGSGQQVVGPKKKKVESDSLVKDIFKQAKEHGAEEVAGGSPSTSQPRNTSRAFRGAGYRLGESPQEPVVPVPGTSGTMPGPKPRERHVVLKMWKTGFSIDDGELRDYREPQNDAFLKAIMKGEIPDELLQLGKGGEVSLDLEDHRSEEFTRPKQSTKAFTGHGVMLGSPTPTMNPGAPSGQSQGTPSQQSSGAAAAPAASIDVDPNQPTTTLQLRLADGSRLTGKFNHCHTVGDIRNFVTASRPQYSGQSFNLLTTFPNKTLTDTSQTIEGAKLMNAVIVQRLT